MFLNNRYYDPQLGVFLSVDPLVGKTGTPYLYAGGNPTTLTDPSGLCAVTQGMHSYDDGKGPCGGGGSHGSCGGWCGGPSSNVSYFGGNTACASSSQAPMAPGACGGVRAKVMEGGGSTAMILPVGLSPAVARAMADIYRPVALVGDGGSADALIEEINLGVKIGSPSGHYIKVVQQINRLNGLLRGSSQKGIDPVSDPNEIRFVNEQIAKLTTAKDFAEQTALEEGAAGTNPAEMVQNLMAPFEQVDPGTAQQIITAIDAVAPQVEEDIGFLEDVWNAIKDLPEEIPPP